MNGNLKKDVLNEFDPHNGCSSSNKLLKKRLFATQICVWFLRVRILVSKFIVSEIGEEKIVYQM